ncbi:MAG TPA: hypothetical protein D7H78_04245 [Candidatus Poseidoniales archaeon]|nr:MAG TPA: hypothetical protein D7H78_04245 [Candidatus Poseidoniales archaeon]
MLLLIGVSLLIGTLFIQEWDLPVKMNPEDEPLKGTSQSFSGDVLTISAVTEEESDVRIEIFEDGEKVEDETLYADRITPAELSYESKGGKLAWKVSLELSATGEVDVDLDRVYFLNFVPYILGALITTAGVLKRKSETEDKEDVILDAIIEDKD